MLTHYPLPVATATTPPTRPRRRARSWVWAVASVLVAGVAFLFAVRTALGQRIDQALFDTSRSVAPASEVPTILDYHVVSNPLLWIGAAAAVVVLAQIRWGPQRGRSTAGRAGVTAVLLLFPPVVALVARVLRDDVLVRPQLHDWIPETVNSAPSGHAAAATAFVVALMLATPTRVRPMVALIAGSWLVVIEFGVIAAGWHRPSDVVISTILVAGVGALLPDPHRGEVGTTPFTRVLTGVGIVIAGPVIVAMYYPELWPVTTTVGIASVAAVMLTVLLPGASTQPVRVASENQPDAMVLPGVGDHGMDRASVS